MKLFTMKRTLLTLILLTGLCVAAGAQVLPYQNTSLPPEVRAADLLSRLTLEEKASLVVNGSPAIPRLGIRQYNWWNEALHGVARNGSATVFPQAIGMAASFDEALIEEVFTAVSDEARVKHKQADKDNVQIYQGLTFWTPNINIFRDPRWGRGMETYGEDPFLTGRLGMAVVRGLQGPDDSPIRKAHACAKHFAVHSGLESNRHKFDAQVSERDLRETYLPAFKDLVTKAHVQEIMTAYNRFRGEPCAASDYLVNTILRGEWGYDGMIVSDCWALADFYQPGRHDFSKSAAEAAAAAVHTGVDVECGQAYAAIPEAVRTGLLDEADLDRNLLRALTQRFKLGEMDDVSPWDNLDPSIVEGPAHRALSLKIARESLVLLQNRGNILPLAPNAKIALIGPNADDAEMQWGNYNPVPKSTVTLLDAVRKRLPNVVSFRACGIVGSEYKPAPRGRFAGVSEMSQSQLEDLAKQYAISLSDIQSYVDREKKSFESYLPALDVPAILKQLESIDIVVFAGGISPRFEGEEMPVTIPGFSGGDRTDIELPAVQRELLQALHKAGKKVVFVNFSGSAIGLVPETESCDAILQAWYPGQEGGTAIADVLFGDVAPSGKLPVTFYRNVDQLPEVEDYNMEGHTYRYFRGKPLYEFGYGLSYTTFNFGNPTVSQGVLTVPVTNVGRREAVETVQLYLRKPDDVGGPEKTLRAFQRVSIPAGGTVTVRIPLDDETFLWWDEKAQNMVPVHGNYELLVGGSSADANLKKVSYRF